MQAPAAMFIESAADSLRTVPDSLREDQQKELSSFGDGRAQQLGATGLSDDFRKGYELGIQTARACLAGDVVLIKAGINPSDLL